tara:strand:+ start:608 stop:760 length:153 start_codon:yes stop_codon:yes gene_type:complete
MLKIKKIFRNLNSKLEWRGVTPGDFLMTMLSLGVLAGFIFWIVNGILTQA